MLLNNASKEKSQVHKHNHYCTKHFDLKLALKQK